MRRVQARTTEAPRPAAPSTIAQLVLDAVARGKRSGSYLCPLVGSPRALLLAVVAVVLAVAAPAGAVPPRDHDGPEVEPRRGVPNRPPVVVAKAGLAGRADLSRLRWSTSRDQYSSSYVNPTSWRVNLNGCESKGGTDAAGYPIRIRTYDWRAEPLEGQASGAVTATATTCASRLTLPVLGRWRVHLTIHTAAGRTLHALRDSSFRDVVIIAFGDSYVSGEGNPERQRVFDKENGRIIPARWTDRQCHRSKSSWAMRAASTFEDSRTAVTFLNYACSGATVENVLSGAYWGIDPERSDGRLPSQLVAAREALGNPLAASTRPVHAVLMSVGVNDAEFSSVLRDCAAINFGIHIDPIFDDPCDNVGMTRYVRNAIRGLRHSYDRLEVGLSANLKGGAVRFVEYPSRVLTNEQDRHGGCGIFEGINSDEAHWITDRGDELNARMAASAAFHRWTYVGGIRDAFRRRGYCADSRTWFRSYSGSKKLQGDVFGTAHPRGDGHSAVGRLVARSIPADPPAVPAPFRLRIEFTRVRVDDPGGEGIVKVPPKEPPRLSFGVSWSGTRVLPTDERRAIPIGRWVEVPEADRVFEVNTVGNTTGIGASISLGALKIDDENTPKGFRVTGIRRLASFVLHRRGDGWRAGTHTLMARGNNASMQLEYTVSALPYNVLAP